MFKSPFTRTQMMARAHNWFHNTLMDHMAEETTTILAIHRAPKKGVLYITRGGQIGHFFLDTPCEGLARLHLGQPLPGNYSKKGMNGLLRAVPTYVPYPKVPYDVAIRTAPEEVEPMSEWLAQKVIMKAQGLEEVSIHDSPHPLAPMGKEDKGTEDLMAICWWLTAGARVAEELMLSEERRKVGWRSE